MDVTEDAIEVDDVQAELIANEARWDALFRLQGAKRPGDGLRFKSFEALVAHYGEPMTAAPLPDGIAPMAKKACFTNAFELGAELRRRDDELAEVEYVEGYARSALTGMVIKHGWLYDRENDAVIDPTWDNPEDCHYFGISWSTWYLAEVLVDEPTLPLLDEMTKHGQRLLAEGLD